MLTLRILHWRHRLQDLSVSNTHSKNMPPYSMCSLNGGRETPKDRLPWIGMSLPVLFSYSSRIFEISSTGLRGFCCQRCIPEVVCQELDTSTLSKFGIAPVLRFETYS